MTQSALVDTFQSVMIFKTLQDAQLRKDPSYAFITKFKTDANTFDVVLQSVEKSFFAGGHHLDGRDCIIHKIYEGNLFERNLLKYEIPDEDLRKLLIQDILFQYLFIVTSSLQIDYKGIDVPKQGLLRGLLLDIVKKQDVFIDAFSEYTQRLFREEISIILDLDYIKEYLRSFITSLSNPIEPKHDLNIGTMFPIQLRPHKRNIINKQDTFYVAFPKVGDNHQILFSTATKDYVYLHEVPVWAKLDDSLFEFYIAIQLSEFIIRYNYNVKTPEKFTRYNIISLDILYDKFSNVDAICIDELPSAILNMVLDPIQIHHYKHNKQKLFIPISKYIRELFKVTSTKEFVLLKKK